MRNSAIYSSRRVKDSTCKRGIYREASGVAVQASRVPLSAVLMEKLTMTSLSLSRGGSSK